MVKRFKLIFIFLISLIAFSCSPRYEIIYIYHPPKDFQGKKCLEKCKSNKLKCKRDCLNRKRKCYKDAIRLAQDLYKERVEIYEKEYKNYLSSYKHYKDELKDWEYRKRELEQSYYYFDKLCKSDKRFCGDKDFYYKLLIDWKTKRPYPPDKPKKPSLTEVINQQKNVLCNFSCGCEEDYNECFKECGGKIEIKKVCVENCD